MSSHLLAKLRALLNLPARVDVQLDQLRKELDEAHARSKRTWKAQQAVHEALASELAGTRKQLREQLLQHHLQLGRMNRLLEAASKAPRNNLGEPLPLAVPSPDSQPTAPDAPAEWLELDRCPGCATTGRSVVCEWNKSVLLEQETSADLMRYNYALCHGCGMLYATRRPIGASYRGLTEDFSETIGRGPRAYADNALLNPYPLSEQDRERYRTLIAGGIFVSDHDPREHISGVYQDRTENAAHVEILAHLLDLQGARVLEVRSRAGTLVSGLRRQFDASVAAMPIFESQQLILRSLCGIECSDLIDYDLFTIPFTDDFDLIACNHMLTHVVRVDRFFDQVHQRLKPGGHLYLYGELDERAYLAEGKSVINTLNALHLQAFDRASLIRLLEANGFEVIFIKRRHGSLLCLARHTGNRQWAPMSPEDRDRRVRAYALARTRAILRAPEAVRSRFADVWEDALAQGVAGGVAQFDDKGRLKLSKDT